MKALRKTIVASLALISISISAKNYHQFDYLGLSFQQNTYANLTLAPQIELAELDRLEYKDNLSATGTKIFIGRQFNHFFAVEIGFTSFGRAIFSATEADSDIQGQFKTSAGDIRVVGTYPINQKLFLKGQLGYTSWYNETTFLVDEGAASYVTKEKKSKGGDLLTGLGIGYGFNKQVAVSFDIEKTEINKIKTDNLGLSLLLRF